MTKENFIIYKADAISEEMLKFEESYYGTRFDLMERLDIHNETLNDCEIEDGICYIAQKSDGSFIS